MLPRIINGLKVIAKDIEIADVRPQVLQVLCQGHNLPCPLRRDNCQDLRSHRSGTAPCGPSWL